MTIECNPANLSPLRLSQEAYWNLYKSEYGISPRFVTEEQWTNLEWLNAEIQSLIQPITEPIQSSYFEDLLSNFTKEDYE
ncbi:hypothetical protein UFOVP410_149 [uncultured Caudovirales phage]|uniref:Uncharacterized protein n=1 Tax=uncultured Caudovirales phage TaxID=2100421 RepID=A0A6J5M853_9CAUD|nr:hypothetical protein UFOVP410_149 [uncultured Caudovirales phage]